MIRSASKYAPNGPSREEIAKFTCGFFVGAFFHHLKWQQSGGEQNTFYNGLLFTYFVNLVTTHFVVDLTGLLLL
jgi:hypothetical protein